MTPIPSGVNVIGATQQTSSYDDLSRMTQATDNNDPADPSDDSTVTFQYDATDLKNKRHHFTLDPGDSSSS